MRSAFRRATIAALVVAFLAPGLIHARPFDRSSGRSHAVSDVARDGGFFSMVWNLLANLWPGSGAGLADSAAVSADTTPPPPPSTATATATTPPPPPDNGGHLDPAG
jgi:hypothetical protein